MMNIYNQIMDIYELRMSIVSKAKHGFAIFNIYTIDSRRDGD